MRSEYFKTAMNTTVGNNNNKKKLEVVEFSYEVLSTAVDFMYGIEIPEEFNDEDDLVNLLHMADHYLMEDLKDATGFKISTNLNMENVFDISKFADKFRAVLWSEECAKFLYDNHASIEDDKIAEIKRKEGTVMAALAMRFVKESRESWLTKLFGEKPDFKRREDFENLNEYENYVNEEIRPGMFVRCNNSSFWNGHSVNGRFYVTEGHIGFITDAINTPEVPGDNTWLVKWLTIKDGDWAGFQDSRRVSLLNETSTGPLESLDLLTWPLDFDNPVFYSKHS